MYKMIDEGVHAEVLDFPGAISFGANMEEAPHVGKCARGHGRNVFLQSEPLPAPDPARTDPDADLEEPIYLLLSASSALLRFRKEFSRESPGFVEPSAKSGCQFVREGGDHSIWENPVNRRRTAVLRHREIPEYTAKRICKQLGIQSRHDLSAPSRRRRSNTDRICWTFPPNHVKMNQTRPPLFPEDLSMSTNTTRRDFLKSSAVAGGALAVDLSLLANVHAQGSDTIRVGLIGCGGRGSGAVEQCLCERRQRTPRRCRRCLSRRPRPFDPSS